MSNDRADFEPEIRNSAWWSGDTRLAANNKAAHAILVKQGKIDPPDLSEVEAVQWGHHLQPVIARIFSEVTGKEVRELDLALTHPRESWLRSHFDYETRDGELVECKAYNAAYASYFSDEGEPVRIPAADRAQCIHEAAVRGASVVHLAVLFGGQRFRTFRLEVSDAEKDELVREMAKNWAHVQNGTCPPPTSPEEARKIWPLAETGDSIIASAELERIASALKTIKAQIKSAEAQEDAFTAKLQAALGTASELVTFEGRVLATWRNAKAITRFNAKALESEMPDVYRRYSSEQLGSRRFLVK
jgi:predicted phage-related endonuclease